MERKGLNAQEVLEQVERLIEEGGSYRIRNVFHILSIFDWWPDKLSQRHLKQMRSFLKEAIKLGYDGYVCFKVGASGCANGMWAHIEESTDGYSPKGGFIYRSFTPDYTCWEMKDDDGNKLTEHMGVPWDSLKTVKQFEAGIYSVFNELSRPGRRTKE